MAGRHNVHITTCPGNAYSWGAIFFRRRPCNSFPKMVTHPWQKEARHEEQQ